MAGTPLTLMMSENGRSWSPLPLPANFLLLPLLVEPKRKPADKIWSFTVPTPASQSRGIEGWHWGFETRAY